MRIYDDRMYLVVRPISGQEVHEQSWQWSGAKLRHMIEQNQLKEGDVIYRADPVAVAMERREVFIQDIVAHQAELGETETAGELDE